MAGSRFTLGALAWRGLRQHRRAHLAALLAAATASAIVTGALVVGDSVRGSLRERVLERLGSIDHIVLATGWAREELARNVADSAGVVAVPAVAIRATVTNAETDSRAGQVNVLGVPQEFWSLWENIGQQTSSFAEASSSRIAWINRSLARSIEAKSEDDLLLSFEKSNDVNDETTFGDRAERLRSLRLSVEHTMEDRGPGLFRLNQGQNAVENLFIPLSLLQRTLEREGLVNAILIAPRPSGNAAEPIDTAVLHDSLVASWTLEDAGLRLETDSDRGYLLLESRELLLSESVLEAAESVTSELGAESLRSLTYLANTIAVGDKEIPYSTVTAVGSWSGGPSSSALEAIEPASFALPGGIVLNDWASDDLDAQIGSTVRLKYFVVAPDHQLDEREANFELRGVVPLKDEAADPRWTPTFPGISDAESYNDWEPTFPVDLNRIRNEDETYWDEHRTTPKAFLSLADGEKYFSTRFGDATSLRIRSSPQDVAPISLEERVRSALLRTLEPERVGLIVRAVRKLGLESAGGATDFSMLFISFSFFLIISAVVLLSLLFRLSCELRFSEFGTLLAVGYRSCDVRSILFREGGALVFFGSVLGALGGVGYAALLIVGLRSLWSGAVNAPFLSLHIRSTAIVLGVVVTVIIAGLTIYVVASRTAKISPNRLLSGLAALVPRRSTRELGHVRRVVAYVGGGGGLTLLIVGLTVSQAAPEAVFFGAGACWLVAGLAAFTILMHRTQSAGERGMSLALLGVRNAGRAPGRSLLTAAVLASAAFLVVAVAAQRRDVSADRPEKSSGDGGFSLVFDLTVPLTASLNTESGRDALDLGVETKELLAKTGEARPVHAFRVRPGDDASCLNLYKPESPRILGAPPGFIERGGFAWSGSLAESPAELENPWLLLDRQFDDGAIAAIGDMNTVMWILHKGLGQDVELVNDEGELIKLRLVGLLTHSIFQGELVVSEKNFLGAFPQLSGHGWFLIDAPSERTAALERALRTDLADYGAHVQTTGALLAGYKQVENTYLSTFQILGGLGLLLGTLGLAVVLYRNVNERRGELALLRAVGFSRRAISVLIFSETAALLAAGLIVGGGSALLAVTPQLTSSDSEVSLLGLVLTLVAILASGLMASLLSLRTALRAPLLPALRAQ